MVGLIIVLFSISFILAMLYDRSHCLKFRYISIFCLILSFVLAILL